MDLMEAKNRVAEALVESIFRRARYEVVPYRREGTAGLRVGREDFSPDFHVRPAGASGDRDFLIEVRYHPSIDQFLSVEEQRGERSLFQMARRQWPDLHFVLVSDRPESGRSCFQAFALSAWAPGARCRTTDLARVEEMGIFPHNVTDHEQLIRRIFALLSSP
ncbi:MAG: hypothetical protein HYV93_07895 [Candidatus Rokubacteria bacterium]|nr:hypothetical protein [Candidatus Rokubacteria bacterium]